MNLLGKVSALVVAVVALTGAAVPDPRKQVVSIRSSDVTLRVDPDTTLARYYTMSYTPPEGLASADLDLAILELYVDVSAIARDEYVNEAPVFEVYALNEPFGSSLDREILEEGTRAARPVAAGVARRVVVDVTQIVRAHLQGALQNNGLVVGSLTGMREGQFVILSGRLPDAAVGRLHVYRRHEFLPGR